MKMEMLMRTESMKPVADIHRSLVHVTHAEQRVDLFTPQMVWARTYAVGCGAFRCEELGGAEDANENALFLVCYYGPGYVSTYIVCHITQILSFFLQWELCQ